MSAENWLPRWILWPSQPHRCFWILSTAILNMKWHDASTQRTLCASPQTQYTSLNLSLTYTAPLGAFNQQLIKSTCFGVSWILRSILNLLPLDWTKSTQTLKVESILDLDTCHFFFSIQTKHLLPNVLSCLCHIYLQTTKLIMNTLHFMLLNVSPPYFPADYTGTEDLNVYITLIYHGSLRASYNRFKSEGL